MKLSKILESIREELKKPLPEPRVVLVQPKRKRKAKMGKKAKKLDEDMDEDTGAEEGEESGDEDEEDEAPAKSKKSKKSKDKGKGKKAAKPDDDEGFVTIGDLATEAEIEPQSARVKLREAELERPEGGRWRWKEGSKALKAARKAVGL